MQKNHIIQKLRSIRERVEADHDELLHLEQLDLQCAGQSDFVDEMAERYCDAWTVDGIDEKRAHRAISRAGFATSWH